MNRTVTILAMLFCTMSTVTSGGISRLTIGEVADKNMPIVVAHYKNVVATKSKVNVMFGGPRVVDGFTATLVIDEVIRRGKLSAELNEIPQGFRGGKLPPDAAAFVAYLQRPYNPKTNSDGDGWTIAGWGSGRISADRAEQHRRMVRLWDNTPKAGILQAVLDGCRDKDAGYKLYCLSAVGDRALGRRRGQGLALPETFIQNQALSVMWEAYTDETNMVIAPSEYVFSNKLRDFSWNNYEPRYEAVKRVLLHQLATENSDAQYIDRLLTDLCFFANHTKEVTEILDRIIIERPDCAFGAAMRIAILYHPNSTNENLQKSNTVLLKRIEASLQHEDKSICRGAAHSLGEIIDRYAMVGPVPANIMKLGTQAIAGDPSNYGLDDIRKSLKIAWISNSVTDDRPTPLAEPWDSQIGQRVIALAGSRWTSKQGVAAIVRRQNLWLEGVKEWPKELENKAVLVEGILKVVDKPAFLFKAGEPFQEGLPAPNQRGLGLARKRYVLTDPKITPAPTEQR